MEKISICLKYKRSTSEAAAWALVWLNPAALQVQGWVYRWQAQAATQFNLAYSS